MKNNKYTILLTGAGGVAIPFVISLLKSQGYRVIAADMDPYAAGLYIADKGIVIPPGKSVEFLPSIRKICSQENVKVIIPLVDEELVACCELENDGIFVLLPRKSFVEKCLDKYVLTKTLDQNVISVPNTYLLSEFKQQEKFPIILKPRIGRGSRGVVCAQSIKQVEIYKNNITCSPEEILVQEYIDGTEFTVSVVVWRDGKIQAIVPKEIISKKGVTKIAITRKNALIEKVCILIQEKLNAGGPFNVQLRLNQEGLPYIFEINPRFSTSTTLTMAAGVDEIGSLIKKALSLDHSNNELSWREGIVLMRQTNDIFYSEQEFKQKNVMTGASFL